MRACENPFLSCNEPYQRAARAIARDAAVCIAADKGSAITMSSFVVILTTVGKDDDANAIAKRLVEEKLAACVNVVDSVRSFYRWEGKVTEDREQMLIVKTRRERVPELREKLLSIHPYDTPEFVVLEVDDVSPAYAAWLEESTASKA